MKSELNEYLVVLPRLSPVTLDVFRLLFIDVSKRVAGSRLSMQQLVELCLDRLAVAVLGALNDQCHKPGREYGEAMPAEVLAIKEEPRQAVCCDQQKR